MHIFAVMTDSGEKVIYDILQHIQKDPEWRMNYAGSVAKAVDLTYEKMLKYLEYLEGEKLIRKYANSNGSRYELTAKGEMMVNS